MKAKMRARLVDCMIDNDTMTISVINLGDKRGQKNDQELVPTSLIVEGVAVKKMAEFSHLINEDNEITLKLALVGLSKATDITEAKINGIEIDFSEIDTIEKEKVAAEKIHHQQEKEQTRGIFTLFYILIVVVIAFAVFNSLR